MRSLIIAAVLFTAAPAFAQDAVTPVGEEPVDPYAQSNANANAHAAPFAGDEMFHAFHGIEGVGRVVDRMLDLSVADPRISDFFKATDMVRLRRVLKEQFCYILGGGCTYSGRDMAAAHKDIGVAPTDFAILVEHLQQAMREEHIAFATQNRLLAKLAPMRPEVVQP